MVTEYAVISYALFCIVVSFFISFSLSSFFGFVSFFSFMASKEMHSSLSQSWIEHDVNSSNYYRDRNCESSDLDKYMNINELIDLHQFEKNINVGRAPRSCYQWYGLNDS
jgi:hypothetical protein